MATAPINFHGRVAIVTGAGKGLGRAYAEALAGRGASVLVNNRRSPDQVIGSADHVAERIRAEGGQAVADSEPVGTAGAGARIVDAALEAFGRIDLVVANAGVSDPVAFHRESIDHLCNQLEVNLFGAVDLVHAALPHLRAQGYGRIVVATSSAALFGDAGFVSYATAKAALVGFVAALGQESIRAGITVNAILPFAHTPMTDGLFAGGTFPAEAAAAMGVEPVTNLLVWLLSAGCHETGQVWVAGGRVFQRAVMQITRGIVAEGQGATPEALGDRAAAIGDPAGAKSYSSGAALLAAMTEVTIDSAGRGAPSAP